MKVHFIAIGGSAMHNLALCLKNNGHEVSGSDDAIHEPSRSRLEKAGILPAQTGWFPDKITARLDMVVLGMHARADNPELVKARELGIRVLSYPEFVYEQSKEKQRIVIAGSHGKTTVTAMLMHMLRQAGAKFDYLVGAQLSGFDTMVQLSDAPIMVIEGDEYLASPIDRRPKFMLYRPHIALITGIAWDHVNVFPTWESYVDQFRKLIEVIEPDGVLVYCNRDVSLVKLIGETERRDIRFVQYGIPPHSIENGVTKLAARIGGGVETILQVFGEHNLSNCAGAAQLCGLAGYSVEAAFRSMASFPGASRRLERIGANEQCVVFRDFAHSPSKVKATIDAVKKQFGVRRLTAVLELHTFSSLTPEFLKEYKGSMGYADRAIVFYNPATLEHKKLPPITKEQVRSAFQMPELEVINSSKDLFYALAADEWSEKNLLLMSSGTFEGLDTDALLAKVL